MYHEAKCREFMEVYFETAEFLLTSDGEVHQIVFTAKDKGMEYIGLKYNTLEGKAQVLEKLRNHLFADKPDYCITIAEAWMKRLGKDESEYIPDVPIEFQTDRIEVLIMTGIGDGFNIGWIKEIKRKGDGSPYVEEGPPEELNGIAMQGFLKGLYKDPPPSGRA